jgi:putative OPT family oligopeptide transporter
MTVSASIPAAVMTVAVFRAFRSGSSILEANLSQTVASASTALATGTIFTIPALFLWGLVPPYHQVVVLAFLGALLGLSAMIPLRRLLIVEAHDELPYPEGTACAEVLRATGGDASAASSSAWIFRGMAVGAAVKLLISIAQLFPGELRAVLPVLPKAELALEISPALLGVGYIMGYRAGAVCVAGALISAVTLTPLIAWLGSSLQAPLYPETSMLVSQMGPGDIWSRYVRYIGAGAVATAGSSPCCADCRRWGGVPRRRARDARRREGARDRRAHRPRPARLVRVRRRRGGRCWSRELVPGLRRRDGAAQRAVLAAGVGVFGVMFVAVARASSGSWASRRSRPRASRS